MIREIRIIDIFLKSFCLFESIQNFALLLYFNLIIRLIWFPDSLSKIYENLWKYIKILIKLKVGTIELFS